MTEMTAELPELPPGAFTVGRTSDLLFFDQRPMSWNRVIGAALPTGGTVLMAQ